MRLAAVLVFCALLPTFPVQADQTDTRLDSLFTRLSVTSDLTTIRATENQIWTIWYEHPDEDVEQLMRLGIVRMNGRRFADAMLIFTQLVESFPNYAEGWNKRATLHYLLGDLDRSIADIEKTLELEPRHFGALSGLGLVYMQRQELNKAKRAFEDLIDVHPNSPNARQNLETVNESLRLGII